MVRPLTLLFIPLLWVELSIGTPAGTPHEDKDNLVDVTESLFSRTIYLEYLYYPGWWAGASDYYYGYVFQLSENSVYNPEKPCRIHVVDCGDGWACLRTRYRENVGNLKSNSTTQDDPNSYYLEAAETNVFFILDTSPTHNSQLKWKIKCTSHDMHTCYISNGYYLNAQLYAQLDQSLNTMYRNGGDTDSWFRWRILSPEFASLGKQETEHSICNHKDEPIQYEFTFERGISISMGASFHYSASISAEVQAGVVSSSASAEWGLEINTDTTWSEKTTIKIMQTIKPGREVYLMSLQGTYGSGGFQPYTVGGSKFFVEERAC